MLASRRLILRDNFSSGAQARRRARATGVSGSGSASVATHREASAPRVATRLESEPTGDPRARDRADGAGPPLEEEADDADEGGNEDKGDSPITQVAYQPPPSSPA